MSALTTEHYTPQSSRTSTFVKANGRSMLFLSSLPGVTVALPLVAHRDRIGDTFVTFALIELPALRAPRLTSDSRLRRPGVYNAYYARDIGRIRAFYLTSEPSSLARSWVPRLRGHPAGHYGPRHRRHARRCRRVRWAAGRPAAALVPFRRRAGVPLSARRDALDDGDGVR